MSSWYWPITRVNGAKPGLQPGHAAENENAVRKFPHRVFVEYRFRQTRRPFAEEGVPKLDAGVDEVLAWTISSASISLPLSRMVAHQGARPGLFEGDDLPRCSWTGISSAISSKSSSLSTSSIPSSRLTSAPTSMPFLARRPEADQSADHRAQQRSSWKELAIDIDQLELVLGNAIHDGNIVMVTAVIFQLQELVGDLSFPARGMQEVFRL
ncbi:MAG: hypothetical protein R2855_04750 [Thermomicrobiales bacterium]